MKKIEGDQLLELMTVKTEVRTVCKEPYRLFMNFVLGSCHEETTVSFRVLIKLSFTLVQYI